MALDFNFANTFSVDGYAKSDKALLDALHIKPDSSTTFHLTQPLAKATKEITETKEHHQHHKQHLALTIEECVPEGDFRDGPCIPLPSNVSENSIFNNIIASFKHDFQVRQDRKLKMMKETFRQRMEADEAINRDKLDRKLEAWKGYLKLPQNRNVLADAFWFMRYHIMMSFDIIVCHQDPDPESIEIYVFLQGRMAKNYIDLFLTVTEKDDGNGGTSMRKKVFGKSGKYKDSFFKNYFNILSQGVFYSFFYACPKSRDKLNDDMKEMFLSEFSTIFAGIEMSNPKEYYDSWYLDLGAGNILKADPTQEEEEEEAALAAQVLKEEKVPSVATKAVRTKQELRYSSIIETYLSKEDFKTRNSVKGYQVTFSKLIHPKKIYNKDAEDEQTKIILEGFQLDFSRMMYRKYLAKRSVVKEDEVEKTFEMHKQIAKEVNENLKRFAEEDKEAKKELNKEKRRLKEECKKHQRRLSRRRDEELEKGAHEYANYLVSMLNAHPQNIGGIQKM